MAGGRVDVVLGGPSCQSFSTHGRRTKWVGEGDERNDLWEHMFNVVRHLKPKAFLLENVPGMVYFKHGSFGDKILKRFADEGYTVRKEILLAADWGVPQRRRRLFIVGILGDTPFEFPEATHLGGWRRDSLGDVGEEASERGLLEHLTVWDAIGDLPMFGDQPGTAEEVRPERRQPRPPSRARLRKGSRALRDHEVPLMSIDTRDLIRHVPAGGTWRDIPPHLLPDRYRGMRRTDSTNLLGRLDASLPAYTITTQFNNVTTGCFTHPVEDRALSVREGARVQTFPDTLRIRRVAATPGAGRSATPCHRCLLTCLRTPSQARSAASRQRRPTPGPSAPAVGAGGANHPATQDEVARARNAARRAKTRCHPARTGGTSEARIAFDASRRGDGAPRVGDILLDAAQDRRHGQQLLLEWLRRTHKGHQVADQMVGEEDCREPAARHDAGLLGSARLGCRGLLGARGPGGHRAARRELLAAKAHAFADFAFPTFAVEFSRLTVGRF